MAALPPVPVVTLNSGFKMPVIGFGTSSADPVPAERLTSVILDGVKAGYRHFDTASLYGSERSLGDAIAEAIQQGMIGSREDLFVTSKLWCSDADGDLVIPALRKTLANLKLDYLDLYLIHWPLRMKKKDTMFPIDKSDCLPFDVKSTWAAMEECQRLGLVKSIGVSNFSWKKLAHLLSFASIPPSVNQVEMNPAWHQKKLRDFCRENGVHVVAYSPLGANGAAWGSDAVMGSLVLSEIARSKEKSVAQISLRWLYEQEVSMVVKSYNSERMRGNLQIFDWELDEEEKSKIGKIPQKRGLIGESFVSSDGPYKTLEELWDEEIIT